MRTLVALSLLLVVSGCATAPKTMPTPTPTRVAAPAHRAPHHASRRVAARVPLPPSRQPDVAPKSVMQPAPVPPAPAPATPQTQLPSWCCWSSQQENLNREFRELNENLRGMFVKKKEEKK